MPPISVFRRSVARCGHKSELYTWIARGRRRRGEASLRKVIITMNPDQALDGDAVARSEMGRQ
jgi:hypothetical protein